MSIFPFSVETDTLPLLKANPHFEYLRDVFNILIDIATLSRRNGTLALEDFRIDTDIIKEIDINLIHAGIYKICHKAIYGKELMNSLLKVAFKYNEPFTCTVVPIEIRLIEEAEEVQNMIIQALCEIRSGASPRCLGDLLKCCYEIAGDENDTN